MAPIITGGNPGNGSDWTFSGGIRFGRTAVNRHQHLQTDNKLVYVSPFTTFGIHLGGKYFYPTNHVKFADTVATQTDSHLILDFEAGKDVGLGSLGSSVLSAGLRFAQFTSKSNLSMHAEPDVQYPTATITGLPGFIQFINSPIRFHDFAQLANRNERFQGLGPQFDWKASTPIAGSSDDVLTFDWGINASLLFGRQKTEEQQQTVVKSYYLNRWQNQFSRSEKIQNIAFTNSTLECGALPIHCPPTAQHTNPPVVNSRSRSVIVPNVGGFAGISFRYADAKISFGYKADVFFNAIDGGIDTRKTENRGFFGPYASISIGIGD